MPKTQTSVPAPLTWGVAEINTYLSAAEMSVYEAFVYHAPNGYKEPKDWGNRHHAVLRGLIEEFGRSRNTVEHHIGWAEKWLRDNATEYSPATDPGLNSARAACIAMIALADAIERYAAANGITR